MPVEEQERQQPRHHHPGNQSTRAPDNPEQVSRLQQVIIRIHLALRKQNGFPPALDIHRDNQQNEQGNAAAFGQQMQPVPEVATSGHCPPRRIQRGQHRKGRGPVIIPVVAIGILPALFPAQAHITHPASPGRKQPDRHPDGEEREQQGDITLKQPADPRENLPGQRRDVPLQCQRIQIKHAISLLQATVSRRDAQPTGPSGSEAAKCDI
ncbi:hypothetical protein D3C84_765970 [compost metagenome]